MFRRRCTHRENIKNIHDEAVHKPIVCEAKPAFKTNKAREVKRSQRKGLHKTGSEAKHTKRKFAERYETNKSVQIKGSLVFGVSEAKHTDIANKHVQKGKGTEERSTTKTRCL